MAAEVVSKGGGVGVEIRKVTVLQIRASHYEKDFGFCSELGGPDRF